MEINQPATEESEVLTVHAETPPLIPEWMREQFVDLKASAPLKADKEKLEWLIVIYIPGDQLPWVCAQVGTIRQEARAEMRCGAQRTAENWWKEQRAAGRIA